MASGRDRSAQVPLAVAHPWRGRALAFAGAAALLSMFAWSYRDYRRWQELGKGGMPATLRGWLRTTWLRTQKRDPLDVRDLRAMQQSLGDVQRLPGLPLRRSRRPVVGVHPVPHRQLDQRVSPVMARLLQNLFDRAVFANQERVHYSLSCFERHMEAITCRANVGDPIGFASRGEIAHIHAIDGSMHMIMGPGDAICAVENGWAELHGLAGRRMGLPANYLMVYAPQSEADFSVIDRLLRAAIDYMTTASSNLHDRSAPIRSETLDKDCETREHSFR